jgi:hypothetical protein
LTAGTLTASSPTAELFPGSSITVSGGGYAHIVILGAAGLAAADPDVGGLAAAGAVALAAGVGLVLVARRLGRSPSPE